MATKTGKASQTRAQEADGEGVDNRVVAIKCPDCGKQRTTIRLAGLIKQLGLPETTEIESISDYCAKCSPFSRAESKFKRAEYNDRRKASMSEDQKALERAKQTAYRQKRNARIKEAMAVLEAKEQGLPV